MEVATTIFPHKLKIYSISEKFEIKLSNDKILQSCVRKSQEFDLSLTEIQFLN